MAVTYASPGVYVQEVDRGTKPIQGVDTSRAAFVGVTAKAGDPAPVAIQGDRMTISNHPLLNQPVLVDSWTKYQEKFGGFVRGIFLPDAVYAHFNNGGGPCYIISVKAVAAIEGAEAVRASVAVPASRGSAFTVTAKEAGAAGNQLTVTVASGEDDQVTVRVGRESQTAKKGDKASFEKLEFTTVEISNVNTASPTDGEYSLTGGQDAQAGQLQPLTAKDLIGDPAARTGLGGLDPYNIRLLVCPDVMMGYDGSAAAKERVKTCQQAMIDYCETNRYCFALLDTPAGLSAQAALEWRQYVNFDTSYAAMYYPWVRVANLETGEGTKLIPPSGAIAGVYNQVDNDRGVHKAPANVTLRGVVDLEILLSKGEQDVLNPVGVNCIRTFPNRGIRVWGGRTLSSDGSWRYINVRRLFIYVEASMEEGLQWVVFEPNDQILWGKVRRDVTAFLRNVWRTGALFGTSPSQAFYVKCDEQLNPQDVRDLGQLIIEVGMAPVKPAEFVIFRISQWAGPDAEA